MDIFNSISGLRIRPGFARLLLVVLGGAAAAGAASAATPAPAADEADALQRVVKYSADSLTTESGARQLYARLVRAAEDVCPGDGSGRRFLNGAVLACRRQALENAVHRIGSPRLAAVHASRTGNG